MSKQECPICRQMREYVTEDWEVYREACSPQCRDIAELVQCIDALQTVRTHSDVEELFSAALWLSAVPSEAQAAARALREGAAVKWGDE